MIEGKALADRVVIVTGGGRGIGSGISEVVAGAGAHVAIIYPVESEEVHAKKMIEKIEKVGGKASSYLCDIGFQDLWRRDHRRGADDQHRHPQD